MARIARLIRRTVRAAATTSRHLVQAAVSRSFRTLTALYRAIDHAAAVRIAYTDSKGVHSLRAITPTELWISRAGDINVRAWDHRDQDTANFRTDRMQIITEQEPDMRILVRHLNPGDQILVCGQPQTVTSVSIHDTHVHLYVVGDDYSPYVFTDGAIITVTKFAIAA